MQNISIKILVFVLGLTSCKTQYAPNSMGLVIQKVRTYDSSTNSFILPKYFKDFKIWYKDSLVIEEANHLTISTDAFQNETWEFILDKYIFIDLRNMSFYEYNSFSDTATLLRQYTQDDSVHIDGGWNFYSYTPLVPDYNPETLTDTTMYGVTYNRFKRSRTILNDDCKKISVFIGYLRCDKKGSIFQFDKAFGEKMGCPLVMYEAKIIPDITWIKNELEFVADKLSPEELKVFATWEKFARKNQVTK